MAKNNAKILDISTLIAAGINPATGLPIKMGDIRSPKCGNIQKVLRIIDEQDAINKLNDGYVLIFAGGLGRPGITTDSTAAKRAIQINADAILAGKNGVDGVYDKDPNKFNDAKFLKSLTYQQVLDMDLKVMDIGAIEILKQSEVETRVFSMEDINNFIKVVQGEELGTTITKE